MKLPIYPAIFCPVGVERPAHIRSPAVGALPQPTPADISPSGEEGIVWAPVGMQGIRMGEWKKTSAGWWINLGDALHPQQYAKLDIVPGDIITSAGKHAFMVPRLLRWDARSGIMSALTMKFKDYAWVPPAEFAELSARVRALCHTPETAAMTSAIPTEEVFNLAIDLLAVNYHLSIHELSMLGWIDADMVYRIVLSAAGYDDMLGQIRDMKAAIAASEHG